MTHFCQWYTHWLWHKVLDLILLIVSTVLESKIFSCIMHFHWKENFQRQKSMTGCDLFTETKSLNVFEYSSGVYKSLAVNQLVVSHCLRIADTKKGQNRWLSKQITIRNIKTVITLSDCLFWTGVSVALSHLMIVFPFRGSPQTVPTRSSWTLSNVECRS